MAAPEKRCPVCARMLAAHEFYTLSKRVGSAHYEYRASYCRSCDHRIRAQRNREPALSVRSMIASVFHRASAIVVSSA